MKIRRLASSHGVGPSLWKSQMAALGRGCVETLNAAVSVSDAGDADVEKIAIDRVELGNK
jgi:hypothetical protein